MNLVNRQGNILSFDNSRRNSGPIVDRDRSEIAAPPPARAVTYTPNNTSPNTTSTDVEKRRAELAALARAVEARLKEAEEKCEKAEGRLEQELRERLMAEQRLKELEENRLRQQQTIMIEAPQARTSTWAQGGAGAGVGAGTAARTKEGAKETQAKAKESDAKLKEAEARSKEAEAEIQTLMAALMEAEQKRTKAEAFAQAAADKARAIESEAGASRAALAEANRKLAEAEAVARVAEENARATESLIIEAEAAGRQATERYQHIEAELQYETKQRATAEQKLKEFEDELSSYLELDWSKGEPDLSRALSVRPNAGTDEVVSQFQAQIEAERRSRREAEEARSTLEHKAREMERALRIAEENNRQIAALNMTASADGDQSYSIKKRKGFKHELKFIGYGMTIALLLMVLIAVVATFFLM
ncbi:MAG TPA: hypothetical protein VFS27_07450 [Blastocatellia bacterium]|nr:hypothetical protein [Blastocatellia bacterium]